MSSPAQTASPSSSAAASANPSVSASQSANPTSSIFSVVEATFSSSGKSRFSLKKQFPPRQSRESQTYVAVSHDIYVLHRPTKDPEPTKLYDFRRSDRFDILSGSCSVTRRADKDACKLRVTYPDNSRPSHGNRDVLTLLFDNEAQMNAFAEMVEDVVASLENLRAAVEAKRVRLKAGGEDSESECEILKYLRGRTTSSLTVEQQVEEGGGDAAIYLTDKLDSVKGALDVYTGITEWVMGVMEAVASGTELAEPLLPVFAALPFVGPVAQLVSVVGDVTRSEADRSEMKEEMKKLHQECGEVTKRVLSVLSSSLDMKHVDDAAVDDLFKEIERSRDVGRQAEEFIMSGWSSQRADIEKVRGLTGKMSMALPNIRLVHAEANTTAIREDQKHVTEATGRLEEGQNDLKEVQKHVLETTGRVEEEVKMISHTVTGISRAQQSIPDVTSSFKRNDLVGAHPVTVSMNWTEGSKTPESELKKKLLSDENSSQGLIGVVGWSGVGKSTILNCVVHEQDVKDWYTGGIYCLDIGQGCDERTVITQIARAVRASGGVKENDEIKTKEKAKEAASVARVWFEEQRCLLVLDDLCTTKKSKNGFVHDVRGIVDVQWGSRVVFSSRYVPLRDIAVTCECGYVNVEKRDDDTATGILCGYAGIDKAHIKGLEKRARISGEDEKLYDAFCSVLRRCNGFPVSLEVAGKTVARYADGPEVTSVDRLRYFQELDKEDQWTEVVEPDILEEPGMEGYKGLLKTVRWAWGALEKIDKPVRGHNLAGMRRMFSGLCVFGQQEQVPMRVAQKLWGLTSEIEAEKVTKWLSESGLVRICMPINTAGDVVKSIRIHDLIPKVCVRIAEGEDINMSEEKWHRGLLDSYATNQEWWRYNGSKGIDDGYMRENLRQHLIKGGFWKELGKLVVDFRWIKNRLRVAEGEELAPNALQEEILSLLRDYEALTTHIDEVHSGDSDERRQGAEQDDSDWDGVDLIAEALRLSGETLRSDPAQVASQLHGRLFRPRCAAAVGKFLESLERHQGQPWIRTIRPCLPMAGDALRKRFSVPSVPEFDERFVHVKYIPKSRELLLSSYWGSRVFLVIDIESERITRRLVRAMGRNEREDGHRFTCPVVSRDGRYVVAECAAAAGRGGSIHLWDLTESGDENHSEEFAVNDGAVVTAVDVTPDVQCVIMGFADGALRVWDINKREVLGDERACPGLPVKGVVVSPSGSRIVTLSWIWNSFRTVVHVWALSEDGVMTQQTEATVLDGRDTGSVISGVSLQRESLTSANTNEEEGISEAVSSDGVETLHNAATDEEEDISQGSSSDAAGIVSNTGSDDEESTSITESWSFEESFHHYVYIGMKSVPQAVWSKNDENRIFVLTIDCHLVVLSCPGDVNVNVAIDDRTKVPKLYGRTNTNMTLCGDEGQYLAVSDYPNIRIYHHNDVPDSPLSTSTYFRPDVTDRDFSFDISPCNKFFVTAEQSGVAGGFAIAESSFDRVTCRESSQEAIALLCPSFDGRFVAIAKWRKENKVVEVWDAKAAKLLREIAVVSHVYLYGMKMVFSPESSLLGIFSPVANDLGSLEENQVTFHKVRPSEDILPPLKIPNGWIVHMLALSRNGRLLAIGHRQLEDRWTTHSDTVKYLSVWDVESMEWVREQQIVIRSERKYDSYSRDFRVEDIWFSEDEKTINVSLCRDRDFYEDGRFLEYEKMTEEGEITHTHNRDEHIYQVWCIASGELKSESRETCCRSSSYGVYEPFMHPRPGDLFMDRDTRQIVLWESDADKHRLKQSALMTLDGKPESCWFDRERKRLWMIPGEGPLAILELVGEFVIGDSQGRSSCNLGTSSSNAVVESCVVANTVPCACVEELGKESVRKLRICVLMIMLVPVAICVPLILYILLLVRTFV